MLSRVLSVTFTCINELTQNTLIVFQQYCPNEAVEKSIKKEGVSEVN